MKPSIRSSELYVIIYVLLLLGARYLGLDLNNIQAQVAHIAGTYHGAGDGGQLVALALVWLGARSGLKALDLKQKSKNGGAADSRKFSPPQERQAPESMTPTMPPRTK